MPEGDTLARTAATLRRWLAGREVTAAETRVDGLAAGRLVGRYVAEVEALGKHLLVRFDSGHALHTHLRMTGSWHVYPEGRPWRRPPSQARLVLRCGERVAVCCNAPVVELLTPEAVAVHPALVRLGPDVLGRPLDTAGIRRRARRRPASLALGELLLDQHVVAGIGNIWRCEALHVAGLHPWTPQGEVNDVELEALVMQAARLMHASTVGRGRPAPRRVYDRAGRPCRRCGALVVARRQGPDARTSYWCPKCQPAAGAGR